MLSSLEHAVVLLDDSNCLDWPIRSFEHDSRYLNLTSHLVLVSDTVEDLFFGRSLQVFSVESSQLASIDVSHVDLVLLEPVLEVHDDEADGAPLVDIGASERDELGCLFKQLSLPEDELMQRVVVHELVVSSYLAVLCCIRAVQTTIRASHSPAGNGLRLKS